MADSLERIKNGTPTDDVIMSFAETKVSLVFPSRNYYVCCTNIPFHAHNYWFVLLQFFSICRMLLVSPATPRKNNDTGQISRSFNDHANLEIVTTRRTLHTVIRCAKC